MMSHRPQSHSSPGGSAGFTLVEALVMLAIIGIAAAFAIPNLHRAKIKTETTQAIFGVAGLLDLARSEAVRRHSPVVLTYTPGGLASDGMFHVFEDWDPNNDNAAVSNGNNIFDGSEDSIRRVPLGSALKATNAPAGDTSTLPNLTTVVFRSDGALRTIGGVAHFVDDLGNTFRIRVNDVTGMTRVEMWIGDRWSNNKRDWNWEF